MNVINNMEKIFIILWITFGLYCLVLVAILADLWSGITKARKAGIIRSSYGFRKTVEKMGRYYNVLFVLTIMDAMQIAAVWYMEEFYNKLIPMFPFITLIGSIGICLIEFKSIYEKSEDKVRFDEVGKMAGQILINKDNIEEVAKTIGEYMKQESTEETETRKQEEKIIN